LKISFFFFAHISRKIGYWPTHGWECLYLLKILTAKAVPVVTAKAVPVVTAKAA
jgi:hypothetical protein